MPSYGATDNAAQADPESNLVQLKTSTSYQELDMRFLTDEKVSKSEKRRKLVSTLVPILIAVATILLFAKVALGAIGPYHDPKYPTEAGSRRPVPTGPATTTTTSTTEEAPVAAPVSSVSVEDTKSRSSSSSSASCSANKACDKLGLTGLCCPTGEGITLGCCN